MAEGVAWTQRILLCKHGRAPAGPIHPSVSGGPSSSLCSELGQRRARWGGPHTARISTLGKAQRGFQSSLTSTTGWDLENEGDRGVD